jgi:hypothetical protein
VSVHAGTNASTVLIRAHFHDESREVSVPRNKLDFNDVRRRVHESLNMVRVHVRMPV